MKLTNRRILPLVLMLASMGVITAQLYAHAVVYPAAAKTGAYERYVLRVPNERDVATTRVEIRFPANVTVVSFGNVPGWNVEVQTDSAQRIIGATWTGTLEPKRFVELPFIAVNPREAADLVWPAFQTYADGERVEWTGAAGSDRPASVTSITDESGEPGNGATSGGVTDAGDGEGGNDGLALATAAGALLMSMIALAVAIGARGRNR